MHAKTWFVSMAMTAGLVAGASAHDAPDRQHVHVAGGLPPFYNVQLIWYQNIVYDDTSPTPELTSLDIYVPEALESPAPVLVYVHGGGFGSGDKADRGELDPMRGYFTHQMEYVFVSVNYRLLPEARYPENTQDVANALAWLDDHVAEYGGDATRLVLMGYDVGGVMAAQLATDETFLQNAAKDLSLLRGVIPIDAGGYDLSQRSPQGLAGFFGPDPEVWARASPITQVRSDKAIPPFFIVHVGGGTAIGGINTEEQADLMADVLREAGFEVDTLPLWDKQHSNIVQAVGEPQAAATIAVQTFLERVNETR